MKAGRAGKTVSKVEDLVAHYAAVYGLDPTKLAAVLSQFGSLPVSGQEQLVRCLVTLHGRHQLAAKTVKRVSFSVERKQLDAIEATTKRLLLELGVNPTNAAPQILWDQSDRPPFEQMRTLGRQSREKWSLTSRLASARFDFFDNDQISAELANAENRIAVTVIGLLFLHSQATAAASKARKRISGGRGGSRHRPTGKGQLTRDAIAIYAFMRHNFPQSGPKPGLGGPLHRFVHVVGALCGTQLSDSDIRSAWRVRKSYLK